MLRKKFLKKVRKHCRKNSLHFAWEPHKGKGSHGTVYAGAEKSTVPNVDLPRYYVDDILDSLGLPRDAV